VRGHDHDFPDLGAGTAIPYGVYDLAANTAMVTVATDHDTAAFAVESIRRWWAWMGAPASPNATRLMITADAGGSNDHRRRTWTWQLSHLAAEIGLDIVVCPYPPATSTWNKIEHRLFSPISMTWPGRPLIDHDVVIELIGNTTTRAGLKATPNSTTVNTPPESRSAMSSWQRSSSSGPTSTAKGTTRSRITSSVVISF
jgi:Rhodopirellula transposase DDE domain